MRVINILLTQELRARIDVILDAFGPDPAYGAGSYILKGSEDIPADVLGETHLCDGGCLYYSISNNEVSDPTNIHKIVISVYDKTGAEIHASTQRIRSLSDAIVLSPRGELDVLVVKFVDEVVA